jgi:predicted Zn-dependent protease
MDKQRDILIERLEEKVKARDHTIAEMARSPPVAEDRIAALEATVKELKGSVTGMLDELLYQKSLIEEMQQKDAPDPKEEKKIESTEYIIAENTPETYRGRGKEDDIIVVC